MARASRIDHHEAAVLRRIGRIGRGSDAGCGSRIDDRYPRDLAGTEISLAGRIVAVADAFDVMTSTRSYKPPLRPQQAREELVRCAGSQFDPMVVRAFLNISVRRISWVIGAFSAVAPWPVLRWRLVRSGPGSARGEQAARREAPKPGGDAPPPSEEPDPAGPAKNGLCNAYAQNADRAKQDGQAFKDLVATSSAANQTVRDFCGGATPAG